MDTVRVVGILISWEATMSDLTDADLEAMEKRRVRASNELYNVNHLRGNASTALEEDIPALIAALREARAERDAMSNLYAHEGHKSLVLLNENTSLLAENRLLRDIVQTARLFLEANPELNGTGPLRGDMEALDCSPSATAAEVERVKRLGKVAEAASIIQEYEAFEASYGGMGANLDAALAELDAGEVNDAT
jgi:hypothetical protein